MRFLVTAVGPDDAEDCFQETFLAALRGYPKLRNASNLRGWLLTIAHRKAIDSRRVRRESPDEEAVAGSRVRQAIAADAHARRNGDSGLWKSVARLAPKQRSAVALRYACDLPYWQIGALMGCSEDAARRSVHEGIKRLRKELANG